MSSLRLDRRAVLAGSSALAATPLIGRRAHAASNAVRVGVLTDTSGPYSDSGGLGSVAAANMAAQDFGGTVLGRRIEILFSDTQNKPDVAGTTARAWYDDGVDAIIDLPVTPIAAAVQQIAREKNRTVMITAAAVSEFTSKSCSPVSSHWADDTHAMATATGKLLTGAGQRSWYFITVNSSFGEALQAEATKVIEASGGTVIGSARFPIGNGDFSSQILQAQSSGASIIGLAAVGGDQVTLIKQSAEFGLLNGRTGFGGFLIYITDIHALGLQVAQGLSFPASYYWDQNEDARVFGKRFLAERKAVPTQNQASVYAGTLHFLKAMAQAGTDDPVAVNKAMRAMPVGFFGRPASMREDGRVLYDVNVYRAKRPEESRGSWDYFAFLGSIPSGEAFLPMRPACAPNN